MIFDTLENLSKYEAVLSGVRSGTRFKRNGLKIFGKRFVRNAKQML